MPELPEVETMRRGVACVAGRQIIDARRVCCRLKPIVIQPRIDRFAREVRGRRIVAVNRLGKRVVLRLDHQSAIIMEPRMTGLVLLADPPNQEHLRFGLDLAPQDSATAPVTATGAATVPDHLPATLWFWDRRGLGSVRLLNQRQLEEQLGADRLGPDALVVGWRELSERLQKSRRAIKPALLDQRVLAGVGNLYASELLHRARIAPTRACSDLKPVHWRRLHAAMLHILHQAIHYEGSTLSDGAYRNALNQDGSYQNQHQVYDRAGDICPQCGKAKIIRIVQTQRATFYCRKCQK